MTTLAITRPSGRDALGNRTGNDAEVCTLTGKLAPVTSSEPVAINALPVATTWDFYIRDPEVDVRHGDRAVIDDDTDRPCRVVGEPARWGTAGTVIRIAREVG